MFCLTLIVCAPLAQQLPAFSLPRSEVRTFSSELGQRDYVLYISLPIDYQKNDKTYPVLVTLDADYAFPLAHGVVEHFADRGNIGPVILVSIAYPGGIENPRDYRINRTRDYTPTHTLEGGYGPEFQKHSGGAAKFLEIINTEFLPFLLKHYRIDENDKALVGHSFGGLFASWVLLTSPQSFQRYLIVSPSYWYDEKVIFRLEAAYAEVAKDLNAHVYLAIGGREEPPLIRLTMVSDLNEFAKRLKKRAYPNLKLTTQVFEGEIHNSVFPAALARGLMVIYEGSPR